MFLSATCIVIWSKHYQHDTYTTTCGLFSLLIRLFKGVFRAYFLPYTCTLGIRFWELYTISQPHSLGDYWKIKYSHILESQILRCGKLICSFDFREITNAAFLRRFPNMHHDRLFVSSYNIVTEQPACPIHSKLQL